MRFELTVFKNTPDFKSGALNHSATFPNMYINNGRPYILEPEVDLNHYCQGMSLISYQLLHPTNVKLTHII